jgi:primosomal protein N''
MNNILPQITANMQLIYRKSIDADKALDVLQKNGQGKFSVIFGDESPFSTREKRFIPYVEELATNITGLENASKLEPELLKVIVEKIQAMLVTLESFKTTLKN